MSQLSTNCQKVAEEFETFACCEACHHDIEEALGYTDIEVEVDGKMLVVCCTAATIVDPAR